MAAEIAEQPDRWRDLLAEHADILRAAAGIRRRAPRFVLLLARGTSDRAALYAKYLVEVRLQLPAGLASPSTMTVYGARPDLRDVLVIAVSQSGGSPDLVQSLAVARAQGALTVAVTNNPGSALAEQAEFAVAVRAGAERAVAATKSYTSQLLALYLLLAHAAEGPGTAGGGVDGAGGAVHRLPDLAGRVLALEPRLAEAAERYRFARRMIITGRGYSSATAQEAALKLMETSYLFAQAFSGADLLHGPLAAVDTDVPVILLAADGPGGDAMRTLVPRIAESGAALFGVGGPDTVRAAGQGLELPQGLPEELAPLLEILPLQQLALHLARERGTDPDAPRGLRKVTETL